MEALINIITAITLLAIFGSIATYGWFQLYKKYPKELTAGAKWMKSDFAEWFIGSWALVLGWAIIIAIFSRLIVMDGHFSRGLGEGSGVDPGLFQQMGWAYRFFAALFLVIAYKMAKMKLVWTAWAFRGLGVVCSIIVIMHAVGFGLKALESKRANAVAVVEVGKAKADGIVATIAEYDKQKTEIRADRDADVASLEASLQSELNDGNAGNDAAAREYYTPQIAAVRTEAQERLRSIDDKVLEERLRGNTQDEVNADTASTAEHWAPLFVGLAQLGTWSKEPSDWAIYVAGVLFLFIWVVFGDAVCIVGPEGMFKLHDKEATRRKMSEMGAKGGKASRDKRIKVRIEDLREAEKKLREAEARLRETEDSMEPDVPPDIEVDGKGNVKPTFDPKAPGDDPPWEKPDPRNLPAKPVATPPAVIGEQDEPDAKDEDDADLDRPTKAA